MNSEVRVSSECPPPDHSLVLPNQLAASELLINLENLWEAQVNTAYCFFIMPKIVRFHEVGGPEVLKLEELPAPRPQKGEVRIKVEAIGLNRAEVMFRRGWFCKTQL